MSVLNPLPTEPGSIISYTNTHDGVAYMGAAVSNIEDGEYVWFVAGYTETRTSELLQRQLGGAWAYVGVVPAAPDTTE